jgi:predicted transglutaminase-like cysteine proteinase
MHRSFFILACLLSLGLSPARAELPLFGTTAVESRNLQPFPKWTDMLRRHIEEQGREPGSCEETRFNRCHHQRWTALVESLKGLPLDEQLDRVNVEMNRHRYILDMVNWGVKDYWAAPFQFFRKDGDCEDYAIAKFVTLKLAGVDPARMRVVVLQDLNLRIAHAVLAVFADDRIRILDNQIRQVVDADDIRHYQPMYSINEQAWWLHRAAAAKPPPRRPAGGPAPVDRPLAPASAQP